MEYSKREKKIKFKDVRPGDVIRDDDGAMFMKLQQPSHGVVEAIGTKLSVKYEINAVDIADGTLHTFDDDFKVEVVPGRFVELGVDMALDKDYTAESPVFIAKRGTGTLECWKPTWCVDSPTTTKSEEPQFKVEAEEELKSDDPTAGSCLADFIAQVWKDGSGEHTLNEEGTSPAGNDCWLDTVKSWKTGRGKTKLNEGKE